MSIDISMLLPLLISVALGCYIQTITGFAFGLVFISCVSVFNLLDMQNATLISCALAVGNTTIALLNRERHADRKLVFIVVCCALPFVFIGYQLMTYLDGNNIAMIKYILAVVIVLASLLLFIPPKAGSGVSPKPVFAFFGAVAGLLGGLFSVSGPPLIFQFYRQNMPVKIIRDCLLSIFAILSLTRLLIGVSMDGMPDIVWSTVLLAFPVTYGFTWLAKTYPPNISDLTLRRGAAVLLIIAACSIAIQA